MSAGLLKRAAWVLRDHVRFLPTTMTGPWFTRSGNVIADDGTDVGMFVIDPYNPKEDGPLMTFIARMDPPVALALADWLDAIVADADNGINMPYPGAYAVARAVLREEATS